MADNKAKTFATYALVGFYQQNKKENKSKKLWMIKKSGLQQILGTTRIGSAQREELLLACMTDGTGVAELSDRFIFFNPGDVESLIFDMTDHTDELKKLTAEFNRLKKTEADKEWAERFE